MEVSCTHKQFSDKKRFSFSVSYMQLQGINKDFYARMYKNVLLVESCTQITAIYGSLDATIIH